MTSFQGKSNDLQALLDPIEEEFDHPTPLVEHRDGELRRRKEVGLERAKFAQNFTGIKTKDGVEMAHRSSCSRGEVSALGGFLKRPIWFTW